MRLLFQDEARFGRISELYRCWAPPGTRPECPQHLVREAVYLFAAVSPLDGRLVTAVEPKADTLTMSRFLDATAAAFGDERIIMVLDGAGWHIANALAVPDCIRLVRLPPYSPELNPAEHLWLALRQRFFANRMFATLGAVVAQLNTGIDELALDPSGIRSMTCFPWVELCVL